MSKAFLVVVSFMSLAGSAGIALAAGAKGREARCLFVSSYHRGNHWSDGIEDGLRQALGNRCVLRVFYMDAKRNRAPEASARAGEQARDLIEQWKPDVVIAADDNAARYLVMPWLRGLDLPVVFCGINWTVEEYGLPYTNATGMVEVAPVASLLDLVRQLLPAAQNAMYLGADTLTEGKNLERTREIAQEKGMHLEAALVSTTAQWIEAYRKAQELDFLIVGNRSGIDDWDPETVGEALLRDTRSLSVTSYRAMTPYSMIGYTKVPEEQGEWAGQLAVRILDGGDPADYPVVANRRWDIWINPRLLAAGHIHLPFRIVHGAKWVSGIGR
ncbi:MAG: hypothetical protein LJE91_03940 [Gammaproteobacteria bacterium]|nr:hypothetical protein [Gammaproteobacteria bacterium]